MPIGAHIVSEFLRSIRFQRDDPKFVCSYVDSHMAAMAPKPAGHSSELFERDLRIAVSGNGTMCPFARYCRKSLFQSFQGYHQAS